MIKDDPLHGLLFPISNKGSFILTSHKQDSKYHCLCYTSRGVLAGMRNRVKDHSDSERGNLLPPHRLLFPITSKGSFIWIIPQTG